MELKDTVELMLSDDYKERLKAEYWQTKIRYERLTKIVAKLEAKGIKAKDEDQYLDGTPLNLLKEQHHHMAEYLYIMGLRAELENIVL